MTGEGFRKGYREGWLAAIHRMRKLIEEQELSFGEAYDQCYYYRKQLHEWTLTSGRSASSLSPPTFDELSKN